MTVHRPPHVTTILHTIKVAYVTTALCGAMGLYLMGATPVYAETVENATRWMNAREAKETQLDIHLQATDRSIEDLRSELARVVGFGGGISCALGMLQLLGFMAKR